MGDFDWGRLGFASGLGFTLVACTFAGLGLGYFLDSKLDTSPFLTLAFFILGTVFGFYYIIKEIKKLK